MHKSTSTAENSERLAEFSAVLANGRPLLRCEFGELKGCLKLPRDACQIVVMLYVEHFLCTKTVLLGFSGQGVEIGVKPMEAWAAGGTIDHAIVHLAVVFGFTVIAKRAVFILKDVAQVRRVGQQ